MSILTGSSKPIYEPVPIQVTNALVSPVAEDRGGVAEDFENYVNLLARLRKRLNSSGRKYGLTVTLVSHLFRYERDCHS